jgi:hypothetical protein
MPNRIIADRDTIPRRRDHTDQSTHTTTSIPGSVERLLSATVTTQRQLQQSDNTGDAS